MEYKIGLAQCKHPKDGDVISLVERWADDASGEGVGILVMPESLMTPYELSKEDFVAAAQPLDGPFSEEMSKIAAHYHLWLVYTMNEKSDDSELPYNTAVIVDDEGNRQGVYRKVHLFDRPGSTESDRMKAGDQLFEPIDTPFGKIGLGICYDLRFPEEARESALAGADIIIYPAAWVAGALKTTHWRTLLAARAIENELFVAGCSRVDPGYVGQSMVFAPNGVCIAAAGDDEELLVARIDTDRIKKARKRIPALGARRTDLY